MLAFTLNGNLGKTTSSETRRAIENLATASPDCKAFSHEEYTVFKDDPDGNSDTSLPIVIPFGQVVNATFVALLVVNVMTVAITTSYDPGSGPTTETHHITLGQADHPEGLYLLFGSKVTAISIVSATNLATLSAWIAG